RSPPSDCVACYHRASGDCASVLHAQREITLHCEIFARPCHAVEASMADQLLLTYRFFSDPDPLEASTPQTSANGLINIAVSSPDPKNPIYCNQIAVAVPVGADGASVFATPPGAACNTTKWTIISKASQKGTDFGLPDTVVSIFTFTCANPV